MRNIKRQLATFRCYGLIELTFKSKHKRVNYSLRIKAITTFSFFFFFF